jgi:hypothetical protein
MALVLTEEAYGPTIWVIFPGRETQKCRDDLGRNWIDPRQTTAKSRKNAEGLGSQSPGFWALIPAMALEFT